MGGRAGAEGWMADEGVRREGARRAPTRMELFLGFMKIGMLGFGGVAAWAHRIIVDERGWLDDREFAEAFAVCQVLPGPNICNLAAFLGGRWGGIGGAALATIGGARTLPDQQLEVDLVPEGGLEPPRHC